MSSSDEDYPGELGWVIRRVAKREKASRRPRKLLKGLKTVYEPEKREEPIHKPGTDEESYSSCERAYRHRQTLEKTLRKNKKASVKKLNVQNHRYENQQLALAALNEQYYRRLEGQTRERNLAGVEEPEMPEPSGDDC